MQQVSGHPKPAATGVDAYFAKENNPARSKFRVGIIIYIVYLLQTGTHCSCMRGH